jgi:hypothetical protein
MLASSSFDGMITWLHECHLFMERRVHAFVATTVNNFVFNSFFFTLELDQTRRTLTTYALSSMGETCSATGLVTKLQKKSPSAY